jgi:hypothetical protein
MEPGASMPPLAGLASWLVAGLAAGALTGWLLVRARRTAAGWIAALGLGLAGGLGGGLVATALGFGGLAGFDAAAAAAAALAGALAVELGALAAGRRGAR